ncbi:MAG: hypothetical protein AAGJ82_15080 [Bacteroidota bacterium]
MSEIIGKDLPLYHFTGSKQPYRNPFPADWFVVSDGGKHARVFYGYDYQPTIEDYLQATCITLPKYCKAVTKLPELTTDKKGFDPAKIEAANVVGNHKKNRLLAFIINSENKPTSSGIPFCTAMDDSGNSVPIDAEEKNAPKARGAGICARPVGRQNSPINFATQAVDPKKPLFYYHKSYGPLPPAGMFPTRLAQYLFDDAGCFLMPLLLPNLSMIYYVYPNWRAGHTGLIYPVGGPKGIINVLKTYLEMDPETSVAIENKNDIMAVEVFHIMCCDDVIL